MRSVTDRRTDGQTGRRQYDTGIADHTGTLRCDVDGDGASLLMKMLFCFRRSIYSTGRRTPSIGDWPRFNVHSSIVG